MEIWAAIPGHEGMYEASSEGRIRRIKPVFRGRPVPYVLKPLKLNHYRTVALHKDDQQKSHLIHRLVMAAFHGPSPLEVNHKNGIKDDNRLENLEYVTPKQNGEHAALNGLTARGSKQGAAKLVEADIPVIRQLYASGVSYKEIATRFRIHPMNIYHIVNRKTWKHVA